MDRYWRYHRKVYLVKREPLRRELRVQFRDSHSNLELRKLVLNRKQGLFEKYDESYDAISQLNYRHEIPIPDNELVEIL